eukprot:232414-Pleurochrysis_carterae.AAC.1
MGTSLSGALGQSFASAAASASDMWRCTRTSCDVRGKEEARYRILSDERASIDLDSGPPRQIGSRCSLSRACCRSSRRSSSGSSPRCERDHAPSASHAKVDAIEVEAKQHSASNLRFCSVQHAVYLRARIAGLAHRNQLITSLPLYASSAALGNTAYCWKLVRCSSSFGLASNL